MDYALDATKRGATIMPNIPYPSVPNYPGVPSIPRTGPGNPSIDISIASPQNGLSQSSTEPQWGIFLTTSHPLYTPKEGGTISVVSFGFTRSMQVSSFPIEASNSDQGAAFASFNKVYQPANPILTLSLSGTENEKTDFLATLDAACESTTVYYVVTPDTPAGEAYTLDRYSYQRSAIHCASMLVVEVSMTQISYVTATLSNTTASSPQSPSAANTISNGNTQTSSPPTSWLAKGASALGIP